MRDWTQKICFLLVVSLLAACMGNKLTINAEETEAVKYVSYSGTLERSAKVCQDSYIEKIVFDRNVDVDVKLELDTEKCTRISGGHVQLAFTKDEAHSEWMDDLPLYSNVQTSYEETFPLYAGYYILELHLIREEDAHVPFKVTLTVSDNHTLPDVDPEATVWFKWGWDDIILHKGKKNLKIDLYKRLGISSWTEMIRTDLVYQSNNKKIAVIDQYGQMTVKKTGTVLISAVLPNGQKASAKLKIVKR